MGFLTIIICLIPSLLFSQDLVLDTISQDGLERNFIINVPTDYNPNNSYPVIINFHGFGSNSTQQMFYGDFRAIAESEGIILVQPQGTLLGAQAHWNVGGWTNESTVDDVAFTDALLDHLSQRFNIDETRMYATGMSNGGYMSYLLACQLGDRFAAIASVTGSMTPEIIDNCNPSHPTPIMQIHGTSDFVVPFNGADFSLSMDDVLDYWVTFNNCNPTPEEVEILDSNTSDGTTATYFIYSECDNNITNEFYRINDGGHTWPGTAFGGPGTNQDINASQEIWKFFSKYDINGALPSSTEDQIISTSVNVCPNPTSGSLNVFSSDMQEGKVFNLYGQEVLRINLQAGDNSINLHSFQSGLYFLKTQNQSIKIIKTTEF